MWPPRRRPHLTRILTWRLDQSRRGSSRLVRRSAAWAAGPSGATAVAARSCLADHLRRRAAGHRDHPWAAGRRQPYLHRAAGRQEACRRGEDRRHPDRHGGMAGPLVPMGRGPRGPRGLGGMAVSGSSRETAFTSKLWALSPAVRIGPCLAPFSTPASVSSRNCASRPISAVAAHAGSLEDGGDVRVERDPGLR